MTQLATLEMTVSGWMDDPLALELLREGVTSGDPNVRKAAIDGLERRGDEASREILRGALTEVTGVDRLRISQALARLGDEGGRDMLVDQYLAVEGEKSADSAARAIGALIRLDSEAARPFAEERMKLGAADRAALYVVLAESGEDWAHDLVARNLRRDSGTTRNDGIVALGAFGRSGDAKALIDYSNDKTTAQAAVRALGHIGGDEAVKRLIRGLKSKNQVEKLHCAASLWRLGEREHAREVIDALSASTDEGDLGFKTELARALIDLEDAETAAVLLGLMAPMDVSDQVYLVAEMRDRDDPQVLDFMRQTVTDRARSNQTYDSYIVTYAIEALVLNAPDEALFDQLTELFRAEDVGRYVRVVAAAGVVTIEKSILPQTGAEG
jgi:HEAT repeat protein